MWTDPGYVLKVKFIRFPDGYNVRNQTSEVLFLALSVVRIELLGLVGLKEKI